ncbi:site-specific integrase, partial [uncultured Microbulbifer sp.]|uniref:site-specific integrase n=1 Tax=uncultured Microbulbifer sp. TaxID=348147 RepID=UPI00261A9C03
CTGFYGLRWDRQGETVSFCSDAPARPGRRVQPALPLAINPHTLRHSFAINHLIHGKTPDQVRLLLGHTDRRSTDVYLRVLSADISHHGAGTPFRLPIEA